MDIFCRLSFPLFCPTALYVVYKSFLQLLQGICTKEISFSQDQKDYVEGTGFLVRNKAHHFENAHTHTVRTKRGGIVFCIFHSRNRHRPAKKKRERKRRTVLRRRINFAKTKERYSREKGM